MKTLKLLNYAQDQWYATSGSPAEVESAVTGETIAVTGSEGLDFRAMLDHGRRVGGPALRRMTFHQRAWMLKDLANAVMARKEELYELSYDTGATRTDGWIDIEGGAMRELGSSDDYREGAAAFMAKRKSSFTGK
ncbi:MAG: paaZ [Alphaproteobacteria bacterium]|nr:paaZ [Alphaproteobacteria bacterium]